jgi:heterodisulfide reductase subunit A
MAPHPVLVIGGGVAGQKAALDLAHAGVPAILVEKDASLGGTTARLGTMFPLHNCLLCRGEAKHGPGCTRPTISTDLLDHSRPDNLAVWTRSTVTAAERLDPAAGAGRWRVTIRREPRHVDPALCISCDRCAQVCPHSMPDPFQAGLEQRKAAHRPALRSVPDAYAIDKGPWCEGCGKCEEICPTEAISLAEGARDETVAVDAVVLATGMTLSDPAASAEYGYGRYPNVFTGLEMERMCSPAGPGEGRVQRRSDGQAPGRIAWIQCVGSRDKVHDYCSSFCCGYATRQAVLARQLLPSSEARIFMMDDRVFARSFSATYDPLRRSHGIRLDRCRLSVLREDPSTRDLLLQVTGEDGKVSEERFGMVVLSVGADPADGSAATARMFGVTPAGFGFIRTPGLTPVDTESPGVFAAGSALGPVDIADSVMQASAAAARACELLGVKAPATAPEPAAAPSRAPAAKVRRIGVFACDCAGEIGSVVDLGDALAYAGSLPGVTVAEAVPYGCLPGGLGQIGSAIRDKSLDSVVIGACKRRTYTALFEKELGVEVQFASLREECSWVHRSDPAGATRKARELLRVAVEQARRVPASALPAPAIAPARAALVVGGGLAGMTAALHIADTGIPVHLVERESRLGGNAMRLDRSPEGADVPKAVADLERRLRHHKAVTIHAEAEIVRREGHVGQFQVTVRPARPRVSAETRLEVGAIVAATGADEYRGPVHGLGADPRVITLLELGERIRADRALPSRLREVAFIGCVGPWDDPAQAASWRCSRGCCETMMRQARAIKEANPGCRVAVLVREVNTYALREELYTEARRLGVLFVRVDLARPPRLVGRGAGLEVFDTSLGDTLALEPEMVVLAAAVMPRADAVQAARALDIPLAVDGFAKEWEPKTRPFATIEPGVFLCGLAHGPKPMREVVSQALAAGRQAAELLSRESIAPEGTVATVEAARCAACLTCVRVCPYSVPRVGDTVSTDGRTRRRSFIDPYRCQGCGSCVTECPGTAITLNRGEELVKAGLLGRWLPAS